jgi:hypothetical protein
VLLEFKVGCCCELWYNCRISGWLLSGDFWGRLGLKLGALWCRRLLLNGSWGNWWGKGGGDCRMEQLSKRWSLSGGAHCLLHVLEHTVHMWQAIDKARISLDDFQRCRDLVQ